MEFFDKFSDSLTLAISSKDATDLDDVLKVHMQCIFKFGLINTCLLCKSYCQV